MVSYYGYNYISLIMTNDGKYLFMVSCISGEIFIAKLLLDFISFLNHERFLHVLEQLFKSQTYNFKIVVAKIWIYLLLYILYCLF